MRHWRRSDTEAGQLARVFCRRAGFFSFKGLSGLSVTFCYLFPLPVPAARIFRFGLVVAGVILTFTTAVSPTLKSGIFCLTACRQSGVPCCLRASDAERHCQDAGCVQGEGTLPAAVSRFVDAGPCQPLAWRMLTGVCTVSPLMGAQTNFQVMTRILNPLRRARFSWRADCQGISVQHLCLSLRRLSSKKRQISASSR